MLSEQNKESKEKKVLGPSKYAGSKKKKKVTKPKKDPLISKRKHDLKVKIKNLRKEIARLEAAEHSSEKEMFDLQKKLDILVKITQTMDK